MTISEWIPDQKKSCKGLWEVNWGNLNMDCIVDMVKSLGCDGGLVIMQENVLVRRYVLKSIQKKRHRIIYIYVYIYAYTHKKK